MKWRHTDRKAGTGENWAEKVCCEICRLLDIPHAEYELAKWKGMRGVITPTFVPENARLVLGNELLGRTKPLTTLEAFQEAVRISPEAGRYWVRRLNQVPIQAFQRILEQVPDSEITEPAREFALKIIEINATRIIETGC